MQAGRMLASMMANKYRYENCAVLALDDGGVMVGSQIAMQLHCIITMMVTKQLTLPRELDTLGGMSGSGKFTYNSDLSEGEVSELVGEYRGYIEEERIKDFHELNAIMGNSGLIDPKFLAHMNVILVSDGLSQGIKLDIAADMLMPIPIESLVVATPIASVPVIDKIHIMADAIFCIDVIEDSFDTNHYYDKNDVPSHDKIVKIIENIVLKWK